MNIEPIAKIYTDFDDKFGIPRQSGLVPELRAKIVFEPAYRNPDALKGLEGFSYLWLIWEFSKTHTDSFKASVRPPRVGGNGHMGVFATRSPYRPNSLGLSSVKLLNVVTGSDEGPILIVGGADILSGTPIYDIKPYLPYADSHPDALSGFAGEIGDYRLEVIFENEGELAKLPPELQKSLIGVLAEDPRPSYQKGDQERIYGISFAGFEVKFKVVDRQLQVVSVE